MADLFFDLIPDTDPSDFEVAFQDIFLNGLNRRLGEDIEFTDLVHESLGFTRGADGSLRELTDDERIASFSPIEKQTFDLFEAQVDRLETAFAGDLPVSEKLKQRSEDQFGLTQEGLARRGNQVTGTNLDDAVAFSTPGIQTLGEEKRTQALLEDEERRGEINTGFQNVFNTGGLLSSLNQRRVTNLAKSPDRFDFGTGAGLLQSDASQTLFNAQSEADFTGGVGGLLGDILKAII